MKRSFSFLKRTFVSMTKRFFRRMGYELVSNSSSYMTMDGAIGRLKARGFEIATVIDVGASNGRWSELCMKYYPEAKYHLFEAQKEYGSALQDTRAKNPAVDFSLCVASNEPGSIYFDDHIVGGGIANKSKVNDHFKQLEATTIDHEVARRNLPPPYFIKLDTHGYEVPILEGAAKSLTKASVVLIECYNFKLNPDCLRFEDMVRYMESKGFRCIDIVDLSLRNKDRFLWQMDIFFAPATLRNYADTEYS
jgi:FkbM family methyltransferase